MNWRKRKGKHYVLNRNRQQNLDKNEKKEYNFSILMVSGGVAQLGERTVRIRKVESSILFVSTKKYPHTICCMRIFF
mgnify:CR=1 FL=1